MSQVVQFVQFNLLPSLISGLAAWLLVRAAVRLLAIRSAHLRLGLLAIPLIKSLLLLLGVGLILPWPRAYFQPLHDQALPPLHVIPILLIWAGVVAGFTTLRIQSTRRRLLATARSAPERLSRIHEELLPTYGQALGQSCNNGLQCAPLQIGKPKLLLSDTAHTPLALTAGGESVILFPASLLSRMDDQEVAGALVHELTHFSLRWPGWCSVALLQKLAVVSPVAGLVIADVSREEERACDEMAVRVTHDAEGYAETLLKTYRYAKEQGNPLVKTLQGVPGLLGRRSLLRARIEHILSPAPSSDGQNVQSLYTCLLWIASSALFFGA